MKKSIKKIKNLIPKINIGVKNIKIKNLKLFKFLQFFKTKTNIINEKLKQNVLIGKKIPILYPKLCGA